MLCRILLTIATISYLICVLVLSGLQNEDLDVSTLNKLQRHNINIDGMNNENLRQECVSRTTSDEKIKTTTTTEEATKANKQKKTDSTKAQLQTIIQFLFDPKSDDHIDTSVVTEESSTIITDTENYITMQVDNTKTDLDMDVKLNAKDNYAPRNPLRDIEKPDLEKFIKVWNMYNKEHKKGSTRKETVAPTIIPVKQNNSHSNPLKQSYDKKDIKMEYNMNKIIMDYIFKNKMPPTTISPPSTKNHIFDDMRNVVNRFLGANNDIKKTKNINENKTKDNEPVVDIIKLVLGDIEKKTNAIIMQKKNDEVVNPLQENPKNNAKKYLNEVLRIYEQIKEPVIHYTKGVTEYPNIIPDGINFDFIKPSSDSLKNNHVTNTVNDKNERTTDENNNIKSIKIPVDILKGIAESIKTMVINELKNDLATASPTTAITKTTITERASLTTLKQEMGQTTNNIMEKFMELFQQFKTIKDASIIINDGKLITPKKESIQNENNGPIKLGYRQPLLSVNPYGVNMPMPQITPIFPNVNDQNTNLNPTFVHDSNKNNNLKNVHKITQVNIFHHKNEAHPVPLTIQTNSYEIAPLGIPVRKPINMVNQNIVVTTRGPYKHPKIDRQHENILGRESNSYNKRKPNEGLNTQSISYRQRTYDGTSMEKTNTRSITKTRERQKYNDDFNDNNQYRSGSYKPHFNKSDYERMRLRNQGIKNYHERLERIEDSNAMDDREDCCKVKIASRQQLPLDNSKNRSRYDDTHFRNFMKTQQKVNDMLERILATKTKSDGPRSVEIP